MRQEQDAEEGNEKSGNKFFRADWKNRKFTKFIGKAFKPGNGYKREKIDLRKLNLEED